jgi:hypothetical protein
VNERAARPRWRTIADAALRSLLGLGLFAAVLSWLWQAGAQPHFVFVPLWWVVSLVGSALANLVTARRWQLLSETMTPSGLPYGVYFHHLAWTRVLGQFLPSLLVDLIGRSTSLRAAGSNAAVTRLLAPLLLERILDLLLPAVLLAWTIAVRTLQWSPALAWSSLAAVLLVFATIATPLLAPLVRLGMRVLARVRRKHADVAAEMPVVSRSLAAQITGLSLARHFTVVLQYWGSGAALGVMLSAFVIVAASPLAQLAGLVGITPGALGIQEGGWAGGLAWFGEPAERIAVFVLATRGAMIVNFAVLSLASWRWRRVTVPPRS